MSFEVYRATNNIKRRPDDGLIESECARFKVSEKDFGIVHLSEIARWMTINPSLQFNFHQSEKTAVAEMELWKEKHEDKTCAKFVELLQPESKPKTMLTAESYAAADGSIKTVTGESVTGSAAQHEKTDIPEEIVESIKLLKEIVADRHPGRTPTISLLDPAGGIWTTTRTRTVSGIQPILCPTARFDLDIPEIHYQLNDALYEGTKPSVDAATHAYFYAGLEFIGAALTIPFRVKERESINLLTDGELMIDDLSVADFILGRILDEGAWKDHSKPFIAALGKANSVMLFTDFEQLQDCLKGQFFVGCD
jgi:hypothetical protein